MVMKEHTLKLKVTRRENGENRRETKDNNETYYENDRQSRERER